MVARLRLEEWVGGVESCGEERTDRKENLDVYGEWLRVVADVDQGQGSEKVSRIKAN